jgi:hypothetical protein
MELVYSTNVLADAKRLAALFDHARISNHVSNEFSAQLPGFFAMRTPDSIGVWLASANDVTRAREIMHATGFLQPSTSRRRPWHEPLWVKVAVAVVIAAIVAIAFSS